LEIID
jgi:hypothetical protein